MRFDISRRSCSARRRCRDCSLRPTIPASARQRLGSISLCGGARSNCPYPQKVSRGRNIRSVLSWSGDGLRRHRFAPISMPDRRQTYKHPQQRLLHEASATVLVRYRNEKQSGSDAAGCSGSRRSGGKRFPAECAGETLYRGVRILGRDKRRTGCVAPAVRRASRPPSLKAPSLQTNRRVFPADRAGAALAPPIALGYSHLNLNGRSAAPGRPQ